MFLYLYGLHTDELMFGLDNFSLGMSESSSTGAWGLHCIPCSVLIRPKRALKIGHCISWEKKENLHKTLVAA